MHLNRSYILIFYLSVGLIQHKAFVSSNKIDKVKCGPLQKSDLKSLLIVGGSKAKYMQYPWMAAIMIRKRSKWDQYCGGSLINSKFVITAGHCFYRRDGKRIKDLKLFKVVLGMNRIKKNEVYRTDHCIKKAIVHEKHNYDSSVNDIGLMELCKQINFEYTKIRPICLPDKKDKNKSYKDLAIVAGWGSKNKTSGRQSIDDLTAVSLPIGNYSICAAELDKQNADKYVYNTTICTYSRGCGKDTCSGDSGGPLMGISKKTGQAYLRGITSFGCPNCGGFGVYTKVTHFLDWINKHTKNQKKKQKNKKKKTTKVKKSDHNTNKRTKKKKISPQFKKFMSELSELIVKYFNVAI